MNVFNFSISSSDERAQSKNATDNASDPTLIKLEGEALEVENDTVSIVSHVGNEMSAAPNKLKGCSLSAGVSAPASLLPTITTCCICYESALNNPCSVCTSSFLCVVCRPLVDRCPLCRAYIYLPDVDIVYNLGVSFRVCPYRARVSVENLFSNEGIIWNVDGYLGSLPSGNSVSYVNILDVVSYSLRHFDIRVFSFSAEFIEIWSPVLGEYDDFPLVFDDGDLYYLLPDFTLLINANPFVFPQINGVNGEHTGLDDIDLGEVVELPDPIRPPEIRPPDVPVREVLIQEPENAENPDLCPVCQDIVMVRRAVGAPVRANSEFIFHDTPAGPHRACAHCAHNMANTIWLAAGGHSAIRCYCRTVCHVPLNFFPMNLGRLRNPVFRDVRENMANNPNPRRLNALPRGAPAERAMREELARLRVENAAILDRQRVAFEMQRFADAEAALRINNNNRNRRIFPAPGDENRVRVAINDDFENHVNARVREIVGDNNNNENPIGPEAPPPVEPPANEPPIQGGAGFDDPVVAPEEPLVVTRLEVYVRCEQLTSFSNFMLWFIHIVFVLESLVYYFFLFCSASAINEISQIELSAIRVHRIALESLFDSWWILLFLYLIPVGLCFTILFLRRVYMFFFRPRPRYRGFNNRTLGQDVLQVTSYRQMLFGLETRRLPILGLTVWQELDVYHDLIVEVFRRRASARHHRNLRNFLTDDLFRLIGNRAYDPVIVYNTVSALEQAIIIHGEANLPTEGNNLGIRGMNW